MRCDFEILRLYLNNKLDAKTQSEILDHLSKCEVCCHAICQIVRDQEADLFIFKRKKQNFTADPEKAHPEPI